MQSILLAMSVKVLLAGFDSLRRKYGKYCVALLGEDGIVILRNLDDVKLNA